jgi:hypothetical protein
MQILFHLGAHCTDNGLLIRSILRNRAKLAEEGIGIPGPGRYRELLGDVSTKLRGEPANAETEALILEAISDDDTADRIVLSNENFLCRANVVLAPNHLYPKADKSAWLRNALPSHDVEFALALRNPATLLPNLLARIDTEPEAQHRLLADIALKNLLWSDVIYRIADANPGARLIVWCHEDTPFIWSEIMRELTGHDPFTTLDGEFDMLETIISDEGMRRLTDFLASRDVSNPTKRRRAVAAFLEAHAVHEAIEEIIDLPGWTDDTVDALSEQYEDDIALVAKMPGVTLIEP